MITFLAGVIVGALALTAAFAYRFRLVRVYRDEDCVQLTIWPGEWVWAMRSVRTNTWTVKR